MRSCRGSPIESRNSSKPNRLNAVYLDLPLVLQNPHVQFELFSSVYQLLTCGQYIAVYRYICTKPDLVHDVTEPDEK